MKCITEYLQDGHRVDLDDLGTFYVTLNSEGADSPETFNETMIRHTNLRWRTSDEMEKALQKVGFTKVPIRKLQAKAKREMDEQLRQQVTGVETGNIGGGSDDDDLGITE